MSSCLGRSFVALLLVVAGVTPAWARATVSLRALSPGLWTAPVETAAGQPPWHLLVDTGTTRTIVSDLAARKAGLEVVPGERLLTPAGPVDAGAARLPRLRVGDRLRTDVPVLVADLSALGRDPRLDGVLGMDLLDADRVVFDFVAGDLTLVDGPSDHVARRGTAMPARELGGRVVVEARLDGRPRMLVLDSGAAAPTVYDSATRGAVVDLRTAGGAVAARMQRTELAVGGVVIGPVRAVRTPAPAAPTGAEGLLPTALFARVDLDRRTGVLRLQPRR